MPKVRRHNLPPALLSHLLDRICSREISADQLGLLADWLDTEPEAPEGKWFKRFSEMIVCGEGELVKTFLTASNSDRNRAFLTRHPTSDFCFPATAHLLATP